MKILFRGNNDPGSIMLISVVLLILLFLVLLPYLNTLMVKFSCERKKYDVICEKIRIHNEIIEEAYEID